MNHRTRYEEIGRAVWLHVRDLATWATARARKEGRLPYIQSLACVDCGSVAHVYDHRDYLKPNQVDPVCTGCNMRRGPAAFDVTQWLERQMGWACRECPHRFDPHRFDPPAPEGDFTS